ncbi:hypothetical protein ABT083_34900 [Streptomyces goshikiensis]|uniref:hypothetical protein n=1 Tax=Streptomyces goshikiensis TaxID=1942 RepID=UPI00331F4EDA
MSWLVRERERHRAADLPEELWDRARPAAVEATGLLDTGPERVFEDLAALAARVTVTGRAFVTLVDARRSFWKTCTHWGTGTNGTSSTTYVEPVALPDGIDTPAVLSVFPHDFKPGR